MCIRDSITTLIAPSYKGPSFKTSKVSEFSCGESARVLNKLEDWVYLEQEDGYKSWVKTFYGYFDDHPFTIESWEESCALCGSSNSFLDEVITDDEGTRMFVCSDSNFCKEQIEKLTNAPLVQNGDGS